MLDAHCEMILDEYRAAVPTCETIKDYVLNAIRAFLAENNMLVNVVEGRVKTESSLKGKLELKGYKYNSLSDITDIVGCRVVTFYSDEVDKVAAMIERTFRIDWENSVDKRKCLNTDQFGYQSLHYICSIPETILKDEAHPELNEIKFEIQIRTTLQHMWATAYHDTGYKSDVEVPSEYIRMMNRLAGLLEIADSEFSEIISDLAEYRRKVRALIKGGKFDDLSLDGDTFSSYLELGPFDALNAKIAGINKAEIQEVALMPYLEILKDMGAKTLGDVEMLKKEYAEPAYQLAVLQIGGTDLDIIASSVGIQNLCLTCIIKNGGGLYNVKGFFDRLYGERPRNARSAQRVLNQAKTLNLIAEIPEE